MSRWANPQELESSLAEAAAARKRGLMPTPPGGWRDYMQQRKEARKKARWGVD
jgi:hypothetical protein